MKTIIIGISIGLVVTGCVSLSAEKTPPAPVQVSKNTVLAKNAGQDPARVRNTVLQDSSVSLEEALSLSVEDDDDGEIAPGISLGDLDDDAIRLPQLQEVATRFGSEVGNAEETRRIQRHLEEQAPDLDRTYNFRAMLLRGPENSIVQPPVIVTGEELWEKDSPQRLRIADQFYEIVRPPEFVSAALSWRAYLVRSVKEPQAPDPLLRPRNDTERAEWQRWVNAGYDEGVKIALATFKANHARLLRDYAGQILFHKLLGANMVTLPVTTQDRRGVTGDENLMIVNDREIVIQRSAELVRKPREWRSEFPTNE